MSRTTTLTLGGATATIQPANPNLNNSFVTRSGTGLYVAGQPYFSTGVNFYNLTSGNVTGVNRTRYAPTSRDVSMQNMGIGQVQGGYGRNGVIRCWWFQNLCVKVVNGIPVDYDFTIFDDAIRAAKAANKKIIAVLENAYGNNRAMGGFVSPQGYSYSAADAGYKTYAWYKGGNPMVTSPDGQNRFSYDTGRGQYDLKPFRQYVQDVVARYANEPTIMCWMIMNEAEVYTSYVTSGGREVIVNGKPSRIGTPSDASQVLRNFTDDIAGLIKGIDSNHLVTLGTLGSGQWGTTGNTNNDGGSAQYKLVHGGPNIDFCEMHDYSDTVASTALTRRLADAQALGKPLYIGESGPGNPTSVLGTARATLTNSKLAYNLSHGIAGTCFWSFIDPQNTNGNTQAPSGYDYTVGDGILTALNNHGGTVGS